MDDVVVDEIVELCSLGEEEVMEDEVLVVRLVEMKFLLDLIFLGIVLDLGDIVEWMLKVGYKRECV